MKSFQIKKIAASAITAAALLAVTAPSAQAANTSGAFTVTVNLTSSCQITTPGTITLAYTSFQAAPATGSSAFNVTCPTGLVYTLATDTAGGTLVGLPYSLATSAAGGTGTAALQAYTVDATIVAGLPGACAGPTCSASVATHTVTVTY